MELRIYDLLLQIEESCKIIIQRSLLIHTSDDFLLSLEGMFTLDGICMKLIFIGESVKNIDKVAGREYLQKYPEISWKEIMGLPDIIVHQYHRIDAEAIFDVIKNDIPHLLSVVTQMRNG